MHSTYEAGQQSPQCRGRYCLRTAKEVRPNKIQRRYQPSKRRSLTIGIADETPVERWCERRLRVVREVLSITGMELRDERRRIPIIDGDRSSIRNIVGSIGNLRVAGGKLVGEIAWARCQRSQAIAGKWQDGHIDDFEVESTALEVHEFQRGTKWRNIEGPLDVVTRWQPVSVVVKAVRGG